jgi:hypothetical protein
MPALGGREELLVMRQTTLLVAAVAATVISISPRAAQATMRITGDPGGLIIEYAQRFLQARASGEQVIIDGACLSACTLAIAMLPRSQVCATSNAVLGFHAAWRPTSSGGKATSALATQAMMELYPTNVRSWIGRHGGLTPRMIFLHGRELASMVPTCGEAGDATARIAHKPGSVGHANHEFAAVRPAQPRANLAVQQIR